MDKRSIVLLTCVGLFASAFTADVQTDTYCGYAYEEGNKKPVYKEEFTDTFVNGRHTETLTNYYDPSNKLIATRTLDFSHSRFAPDFRTEDLRTGYVEGAEVNGADVKLFVKKDKNSAMQEKTLTIPQPMVIDGGFNQFMKANWSRLQKNEQLTFYFTVPARMDYFKLRATNMGTSGTEMKVRIDADKALIRMLASAIVVSYDINTKRITSYEGKSNIAGDDGSNPIITLVYPKKGP